MFKNIKVFFGLFIILVSLMASCGAKKRTSSQSDPYDTMSIEMRNNNFAWDIFRVISPEQNTNLIVSPFSISTALAMTYAGADGQTEEQMSRTLYFSPNDEAFHAAFSERTRKILEKGKKEEQLSIANSLWPQEGYPFIPEFMELLNEYYGSALYPVDYMGNREIIRNRINQWVADHTNNLIKELIKPGVLIPDTRLVLVNAIYFLSDWKIAFDLNATRPDNFHLNDGSVVRTPFMYMKDEFMYYENNEFQLLELPYKGGDFSFLAFLPAEDLSVEDLIKMMDATTFSQSLEQLSNHKVDVFLPSFKVRSQMDLEEVLARMGMPLAFSNDADFSRMTPRNDLKIDKVIHEAYIDVNEEGTEAAASTAVVIIRKTAVMDEERDPVFRADRPFIFAIKENSSNAVLFLGKIENPSLRAN